MARFLESMESMARFLESMESMARLEFMECPGIQCTFSGTHKKSVERTRNECIGVTLLAFDSKSVEILEKCTLVEIIPEIPEIPENSRKFLPSLLSA